MKRLVAGALAGSLMLGGCGLGSGLYNAPLPGGADLGDHPYKIRVKFSNALDLVPQSGVKVNDVAVGRVTRISLEKSNGKVADVWVEVRADVHLPANAVASIDQTSLLGEKYVSLAPPLGPQVGTLRNDDTIPESHTSNGVEVETVFGALSLVLNGGGIGDLHEITQELNTFTHGHEGQIREFLASVTRVVGQMNAHKTAITAALDALATLATTLKSDNSKITNVLKSFAPGIAVLADQRDQLIAMLTSLNRLSTVTEQTLDASKSEMIGDFKALAPIISQLAAAGSALPQSLQILLTYPFPDAAMKGIVGDYVNAYVRESLRTPCDPCVNVTTPQAWPAVAAPAAKHGTGAPPTIAPPPSLLPPTGSAAPGLPSTLTVSPTSSGASTAGSDSDSDSDSGGGS